MLPDGMVGPRAILTLKVADEGDKTIWVTETPEEVTEKINACETRLISFTRVKGMRGFPYSTRPDNIANVGDASW